MTEKVEKEVKTEKPAVKADKPAKTKKTTVKKTVAKKIAVKKVTRKPGERPAINKKEEIQKKVNAFFDANKDNPDYKKLISAEKLMEAGAHIGLANNMWNPKMAPFIYRSRNTKNHTIDILKILVFLNRSYNFLNALAKQDGKVLFVGTHNDSVKKFIAEQANRVGAFYINQRWLGGTLTNYRTVANSINKLNRLTSLVASDTIQRYTKKQQLDINKQIAKLEKFIGGIKNMKGLPQVVIVTDPIAEHNAVKEARDLKIPVIALANTNANPNLIDFIIPANTHSVKTEWLLLATLADAIASAKGEATVVVDKADGEIVLPEVVKQQRKIVFTRKQADTFVKEDKKSDLAK